MSSVERQATPAGTSIPDSRPRYSSLQLLRAAGRLGPQVACGTSQSRQSATLPEPWPFSLIRQLALPISAGKNLLDSIVSSQEGPIDRYTQTADLTPVPDRPDAPTRVTAPRPSGPAPQCPPSVGASVPSRPTVSGVHGRRPLASTPDMPSAPSDHPAQGGHPSGRSPPQPTVWADWVVRHSYSPANPHRWTTADDQRTRPAMGVGRGSRPPWCPLAPSSRPSRVSTLDGCPAGCPIACPAVRSGASIRPPVAPGRGRRAGWAGAGDRRGDAWPRPPDRGRPSAATSPACCGPSRGVPGRPNPRLLVSFLHPGPPKCSIHCEVEGVRSPKPSPWPGAVRRRWRLPRRR
jgi:hypothetical protein